jgi:hypothetical protein
VLFFLKKSLYFLTYPCSSNKCTSGLRDTRNNEERCLRDAYNCEMCLSGRSVSQSVGKTVRFKTSSCSDANSHRSQRTVLQNYRQAVLFTPHVPAAILNNSLLMYINVASLSTSRSCFLCIKLLGRTKKHHFEKVTTICTTPHWKL